MIYELFIKILNQFSSRLIKYFIPKIKCPIERHGSSYGTWTICPLNLNSNSIVYSFGIGTDISFDKSLIKKYGLNVFAFDPTPKSLSWINSQRLPKRLNFFNFGIANFNGRAKFYLPKNPNFISHSLIKNLSTLDKSIEVKVYSFYKILNMYTYKYTIYN